MLEKQIGYKSGTRVMYDTNTGETVVLNPSGEALLRYSADGVTYPQGFANLYPTVTDDRIHYVSQYNGLMDAVNNSTRNDVLILEPKTYSGEGETIERRSLIGPKTHSAKLSGTWSVKGFCTVENVEVTTNANVIVEGAGTNWSGSYLENGAEISVTGNGNKFTTMYQGGVKFESGSENNVADSSVRFSVTDNGTGNVVGDIA